MKIFGYQRKKANSEGLLEMKEITFQGSSKELRAIAEFLLRTSNDIEINHGKFDHEHISFNNPNWNDDQPDIIVAEDK